MLELFKIAGVIDLQGSEKAEKDLDNLDKKGGGLGAKLGNAAKGVAKAGAVMGGALAGAGALMGGLATKAAGATDRIDKMSQKLGLSRQGFAEWDYILSQNGASIDSMGAGMKTLTNQVDDLASGGKVATDAFGRLGMSYDDLAGLSQEEIFEKTIVALQGVEDEAQRAALANDLLGRSGQELAPLLNAGADSVEKLKQQANDLGLVLSDDAVDAGVLFTDTMDNLKRSFGSIFTQIGVSVMPIMQKFSEWVIANMPTIQAVFQTAFDIIGQVITTAVTWFQTLISWIQTLFTSNQETFNGIWQTIQNVFTSIWEHIQLMWGMVRTFWEENGQAILENAMTIFNSIKDTVFVAFENIWQIIQNVMEMVRPYIQEVLGKIQEFWNENGEQIMSAVKNAFEFIQGIIEFIMPIITKVIEFAWGLIKNIIDGALNVIMGLIKIFSGIFTGDWKKVWEGVKQIVGGIFDTIKNIFGNIFSAIGNIMGNIADTIKNTFMNVVDWLKGLRGTFLDAGKGLIEQLIKGIKNMAKKVTDTVKGIAKKIRDFLPFSPAKVGPLSDLDKLDFEGPITDSIRKGEKGIQRGMADLLNMAEPSIGMNVGSRGVAPTNTVHQTNVTMGSVESLLVELIQAVKQNKDVIISDSVLTDAVNTRNAIDNVGRVFG